MVFNIKTNSQSNFTQVVKGYMGSEHIYDVLKICILFKISQRLQIKLNQKMNFNFNTHMKAIEDK